MSDHRVTVGCGLRLLDVQPGDAGHYLVIFPARLEDNIRMVLEMEVKKNISRTGGEAEEMPWRTGDVVALCCVATFVGTLFGIFIGKFYKKISFPAFMAQNNNIKTPTKSSSKSFMKNLTESAVKEAMISPSSAINSLKNLKKTVESSVKKESSTKPLLESPMKKLMETPLKSEVKVHEEGIMNSVTKSLKKAAESFVKVFKESPTTTLLDSPMKTLTETTPKNSQKTQHEEITPYQI